MSFSLAKSIEVVKGTSLSSVVGSTSRFLTIQIEKKSHSSASHENNIVLQLHTSTEALYRPTSSQTPRRSNTVPSRNRKSQSKTTSNKQTTHLSPSYQCKEDLQAALPSSVSQPFSPSLLTTQPKRRIRVIDEPDDVDSITSSLIHRND